MYSPYKISHPVAWGNTLCACEQQSSYLEIQKFFLLYLWTIWIACYMRYRLLRECYRTFGLTFQEKQNKVFNAYSAFIFYINSFDHSKWPEWSGWSKWSGWSDWWGEDCLLAIWSGVALSSLVYVCACVSLCVCLCVCVVCTRLSRSCNVLSLRRGAQPCHPHPVKTKRWRGTTQNPPHGKADGPKIDTHSNHWLQIFILLQ